MTLFRNNYFKLLLAVALFIGAFILDESNLFDIKIQDVAARFEHTLWKKEKLITNEIQLLSAYVDGWDKSLKLKNSTELYSLATNEDLYIYIFRDDTLVFWSTNNVPIEVIKHKPVANHRFQKLQNGWYETLSSRIGNYEIAGLVLIKHEYLYENKHLQNVFQDDFPNGKSIRIASDSDINTQIIRTADGIPLFSISCKSNPDEFNIKLFIVNVINIIAILLILVFLKNSILRFDNKRNRILSVLFFCAILISLRVFLLIFNLPASFYELEIFNPEHFAASAISPSIGDLFINILLILYCVYLLKNNIPAERLYSPKASLRFLVNSSLLCLIYGFALLIESQIRGLVEDSNISFDVNNLFNLNLYSYTGIVITCMLFFTIFFIVDKSVEIIKKINDRLKEVLISFVLITALYALHSLFELNVEFVHFLWPIIVLGIIFMVHYKNSKNYSFINILLILAVFSVLASYYFTKFIDIKEHSARIIRAQELSNNEDPLLELSFKEIKNGLCNDSFIKSILSDTSNINKATLDNYLVEHYFTGYFSRFDIRTFSISGISDLSSANSSSNIGSVLSLENTINNYGRSVSDSVLFYIDKPGENTTYLADITYKDSLSGNELGEIFIIIQSQLLQDDPGFPDLLIDRSTSDKEDIGDYSFARYQNGKLINQHGRFSFSYLKSGWMDIKSTSGFVNRGGYSHFLLKSSPGSFVILSKHVPGFISSVTTFSYLFAFYSILLLLFVLARNMSLSYGNNFFNINRKIQFLLIVIILTSTVLFGLGTTYFIKKQYDDKNNKSISERMRSVLIEVKHKLNDKDDLSDVSPEYLSNILSKFSNVFFTDINLYNPNGLLIASSRMEIFKKGLTSELMDPVAYKTIKNNHKSSYVHRESIGGLQYLSAYAPFSNKYGQIIAYLNLPYFSKQDVIEKEISSFLIALINIYVFLFALSVIAALLISGFVTMPLRKLHDMLSNIELGKSNVQIQYNKNDEIGQLVKVYNEKVVELQKNVELLAKTERESAWRDMAKQVAHEIKNPLTPMKLSIQHLIRLSSKQKPVPNDEIVKFSNNVINQINSLSQIADEFSHFAKMPSAKFKDLNLYTSTLSAVNLFDTTNNISLKFISFNKNIMIYGDKDQISRIIINLIKNAIQSIPALKSGIVEVKLYEDNYGNAILSVADNGVGIPDEDKDNIFIPNFTTKTTGMGMGLAILKTLVENHRGKVWFESTINKGTTFYVSIPKLL